MNCFDGIFPTTSSLEGIVTTIGMQPEHLDYLHLDSEESPILSRAWCKDFGRDFLKNGKSISGAVDKLMAQRFDMSLGFVVNPGGGKKADITSAIALFTEDDSGASIEDQMFPGVVSCPSPACPSSVGTSRFTTTGRFGNPSPLSSSPSPNGDWLQSCKPLTLAVTPTPLDDPNRDAGRWCHPPQDWQSR